MKKKTNFMDTAECQCVNKQTRKTIQFKIITVFIVVVR